MIRQNDVRLLGFVATKPQITVMNGSNEPVRGIMMLTVIRSARFNGENNQRADRIMYDYPIILSTNKEQILKMQKFELYDMVEIKGTLVTSDSPDVSADYPLVRSYGFQAKKDSLCLKTGSMILIDGYLHTRKPPRQVICQTCGKQYEWTDSVMEVIPFVEEYLNNYTDYATAKQQEDDAELKKAQERLNG